MEKWQNHHIILVKHKYDVDTITFKYYMNE